MTNKANQQDKLWVKCPQGAIQQVADSAMVTRAAAPAANLQRRKMLIATATAAGVAVIGGAGYLATRKPAGKAPQGPRGGGQMANYNFGGINCIEVVQIIPDYIEKTIGQEKTESVEQHLKLCDKCRMIYENQLQS